MAMGRAYETESKGRGSEKGEGKKRERGRGMEDREGQQKCGCEGKTRFDV